VFLPGNPKRPVCVCVFIPPKWAISLEHPYLGGCVLPCASGPFGEDGTLSGICWKLADVAYVGAEVVGSAVGMDKGVFKDRDARQIISRR